MPQEASSPPTVKATLGLTGATVNAMALIAPGASPWTRFTAFTSGSRLLASSQNGTLHPRFPFDSTGAERGGLMP